MKAARITKFGIVMVAVPLGLWLGAGCSGSSGGLTSSAWDSRSPAEGQVIETITEVTLPPSATPGSAASPMPSTASPLDEAGSAAAKPSVESTNTAPPPAGGVKTLGGVPLGGSIDDVTAAFGSPTSQTVWQLHDYDGREHATWTFADAGVSADVSRHKDDEIRLDGLAAHPGSTATTTSGIGVGDSRDTVLQAYGDRINVAESRDDFIVVGSVYGGVVFEIADGVVGSIYLGALAE